MTDLPIYDEQRGVEALEWVRVNNYTGALEVLVSQRAYTGRVDPVWTIVERVAQGTASVYPVKGTCTNGARGQWKVSECLAVRLSTASIMVGEEQAAGYAIPRMPDDFPWPDGYPQRLGRSST